MYRKKSIKINGKIALFLLLLIVTLESCNKNGNFSFQNKSQDEITALSNNDSKVLEESIMELKEDAYDFKDIKKGETVSHVFYFTNKGDKPLIISEVKPSCGCTTPKYTKEPVAPGGEGSITVTFDSSNFEGTVHKTVSILGNFKPQLIKFQAKIN